MKPITFESIRNFIKTKKKNKKDGADTSFKRSDSFKRISIRKSYLDRGRNKRTARTAAAAAAAAVSVAAASATAALSSSSTTNLMMMGDAASKVNDNHHNHQHHSVLQQPTYQDVSEHHPHQMARRSLSVVVEQHYSSRDDVNDDLLLKNKSLHEINEICGGSEVVKYDVIVPNHHQPPADQRSNESVAVVVCGDIIHEDETEVQMVQMNFGESIYDNLAADTNAEQDDHDDDNDNQHDDPQEQALGNHDASTPNTTSICSYFMLHDNIYDRADSVGNRTLQGRCGSPSSSTNVSSMYVNHRDDQQQPFSDPHQMNTPSSVTFTTFGEPRIYLETSFDSPEPQSFLHTLNSTTSSREDNVSRTSLNNRIDIDSHTFKMPNKPIHSDGVVIRIPAKPTVDPLPFKPAKTTILLNSPAADLSPDDLETSLNGKFTFEIYKELQRSQDSIIQSAPKPTENLNEHFSSLQLHQPLPFPLEDHEEPDFYDDLPSNNDDGTVPHSVSLKINPFTRQKELYSVNLGRIWKQLNLGQDDMSLDGSSMQGNFKKKNESFKSMSSQDSGFSLTLTKPKSPFRGRSKKGRRKASGAPPRSALPKEQPMRSRKFSGHPSSKENIEYGYSGRYNASEFDATLRRTLQRQRSLLRSPEQMQDENMFLREFEQFCLRRNQMKLVQKNQFRDYEDALGSGKSSENDDDELDFVDDDVVRPVRDNFKQEINDLEAFFEEHLKRLKEYYLQKKQITERTVDKICHEFDDDEERMREAEEEDDHNGEFHSLGRPDSVSPPLVQDFNFPHPDKRAASKPVSGKLRTKFHAPEVRSVRNAPCLNYAALEFQTEKIPSHCNFAFPIDRIAYADLQFPPPEKHQSQVGPKTIALSSIFPPANYSTTNLNQRCPSCYRLQRKSLRCQRRRRRSTTNSIQLQTSSSNDEFSEQEFIASTGLDDDDSCPNCDRTDCECDTNGQWCLCSGDHLLVRRNSAVNKSRRVKRKKSAKRRSGGGRNHSTLRRCSSYYNNTASSNNHMNLSKSPNYSLILLYILCNRVRTINQVYLHEHRLLEFSFFRVKRLSCFLVGNDHLLLCFFFVFRWPHYVRTVRDTTDFVVFYVELNKNITPMK